MCHRMEEWPATADALVFIPLCCVNNHGKMSGIRHFIRVYCEQTLWILVSGVPLFDTGQRIVYKTIHSLIQYNHIKVQHDRSPTKIFTNITLVLWSKSSEFITSSAQLKPTLLWRNLRIESSEFITSSAQLKPTLVWMVRCDPKLTCFL